MRKASIEGIRVLMGDGRRYRTKSLKMRFILSLGRQPLVYNRYRSFLFPSFPLEVFPDMRSDFFRFNYFTL